MGTLLLDKTGNKISNELDNIQKVINGQEPSKAPSSSDPDILIQDKTGKTIIKKLKTIVTAIQNHPPKSKLSELNDTLISNPSSGQVLSYNGTTWINNDVSGVTVTTTDPGAGSNLKEGNIIAVIEPSVVSISITTPPTKTSYSVGETLDLTGMVVTASLDNGTTANVTSQCTFSPANGATLSTSDTSVTVSYKGFTANQSISVNYPIYGVQWDGTSTTAWTRTDSAVGFSDPNPYYSNMSTTPSSPFDNISPWKDMQIVEDTNAGTLVSIPKFYYKLTQSTSSSGMKIQISESQFEGSHISPAHMDRGDGAGERDVIYVGRYHCSSGYKSVTGQSPSTEKTRSTMRTTIHNLGSDIWQWDFTVHFTIQLLYLVEFADWNSQGKIGYGCGNGGSQQTVGFTDSMPYHTGTTQSSRTTYGLGTQYRYIEGLWDNAYDWLDGCYNNPSGLSIILNPINFSDSSGGTLVGLPTSEYPSQFTVEDINGLFPTFIPTTSSGSYSTYSCDTWYFNESYPCLFAGGYYSHDLSYGLFCVSCANTTDKSASLGTRLMKLPSAS